MALPLPTTKAKQRDFIDALIDAVLTIKITRAEIATNLRVLRRQLRNRKPVKRAPTAAQTVTPVVKQKVINLNRRYPNMTNQHIADKLNINAGRVSEVLAGKRY